jgi:hypothetical protein
MQSLPDPSSGEIATCDHNALAAVVASQSYQYTPLDKTKQQIRLVKLYPPRPAMAVSLERDVLRCAIETFDLKTVPEYIALSYTWGNLDDLQIIYIDDKPFIVRKSLSEFLHVFRWKKANNRPLWIDQLCIDQTAVDERNHQVRLMSQIYQNSKFVIMWLGAFSATQASRFLAQPNYATTRQLLQNRYFTRLWIVQEIWLAPKVSVLCGSVWIPWNSITGLVNEQGHFSYPQARISRLWKYIPEEDLLGNCKLDLRLAIRRFANMQCEDPRDKVYGFLGLVNEQERLEVDYSKSLYQVYSDALNFIYRRGIVLTRSRFKFTYDFFWKEFAQDVGFSQKTIDVLAQLYMESQICSAEQKLYPEPLMIEFQPANSSAGTPDRWWLEVNGQRRYYICNPGY